MTDYLLTHVLQRLYRDLGATNTSKATSGTEGTIVDLTLKGKFSGKPFVDGVAFVARTTDSLAPQGEFQRISKYESAITTFTVDTNFSAQVGAGDVYSWADSTYPCLTMIDLVNDALKSLGLIDLVDLTTLTTAEEKTEYAASVAWKRARPTLIQYAANPSDADDMQWRKLDGWEWSPAAAGATGLIIFPRQPPVTTSPATPLKIWYKDLHPEVAVWNSKIHETIPVELLAAKVLEKALNYQNKLNSGQDEFLISSLMDSRHEYDRALATNPMEHRAHKVKTIDIRVPKYR